MQYLPFIFFWMFEKRFYNRETIYFIMIDWDPWIKEEGNIILVAIKERGGNTFTAIYNSMRQLFLYYKISFDIRYLNSMNYSVYMKIVGQDITSFMDRFTIVIYSHK